MHTWFQNLNENKRRLFHFRGTIGSNWNKDWFKFELASGRSFSFELFSGANKTSFTIGLFVFTLYLTIYGLKTPFLTKEREYGFRIYNWELWAHFGSKRWESNSNDPWYYRIVVRPLDLVFGEEIYFTKEVMKSYSPVEFEFRGKTFQMDSIVIEDRFRFRSRIPFGIYKRVRRSLDLKIEKPPGYRGKGENSWDCDDDASFGISAPYNGPKASWQSQKDVFDYCCQYYCENVSKSIQRYGRVSSDSDLKSDVVGYKYLGFKKDPNCAQKPLEGVGIK